MSARLDTPTNIIPFPQLESKAVRQGGMISHVLDYTGLVVKDVVNVTAPIRDDDLPDSEIVDRLLETGFRLVDYSLVNGEREERWILERTKIGLGIINPNDVVNRISILAKKAGMFYLEPFRAFTFKQSSNPNYMYP